MKKLLLKQAASGIKLPAAKKVVLIAITFLLFDQPAMAQWVDTLKNKPAYNLYMHKRKVNNTVGAVLLGSGFTMMAVGFARMASGSTGDFLSGVSLPKDGIVLFAAGTGAALVSIPFFISAGSNKRKARLSLKANSVAIGEGGAGNFNYMTASLKVHF
jgi:hypothetical protein